MRSFKKLNLKTIKFLLKEKNNFLNLKIIKKKIKDHFNFNEINLILNSKFSESNFYDSKEEILNFLNAYKKKENEFQKRKYSLRNIIFFINLFFKGFFFLIKYILSNNYLKRYKKNNLNSQIIFLNYFFNFDQQKIKKKYFSKYWKNVPNFYKKNQYEYLHQVFINKHANKIYDKDAKEKVDNFNHTFLENYLNIKSILKILYHYLRLSISHFFIFLNIDKNYCNNNVFKNFKKTFILSITGSYLLRNLIYYYQIRNFLDSRKKIKRIFFLFENLTWEQIFISLVKMNRPEIQLIFYIHTPVRFLDLKLKNLVNKKIKGDIILLTSKNDLKNLRPYYPRNHFFVENIRIEKINKKRNSPKMPFLILLGFDNEQNDKIISIINRLDIELLKKISLKLHPATKVKIPDKTSMHCKLEKRDISKIIRENIYKKYICAGDSSVSFDLIVNKLDFAIFDLNPMYFTGALAEIKEIIYIRNLIQLKKFILSKKKRLYKYRNNNNSLAHLIKTNNKINSWKKIINEKLQ